MVQFSIAFYLTTYPYSDHELNSTGEAKVLTNFDFFFYKKVSLGIFLNMKKN